MSAPNTNGAPAVQAPKPPGWVDEAPLVADISIDMARGVVQFKGRQRLAISDSVLTIPIQQLLAVGFQISGVMLGAGSPLAKG